MINPFSLFYAIPASSSISITYPLYLSENMNIIKFLFLFLFLTS